MMLVIDVVFRQTWRPSPGDPSDGTVLETHRCATAAEAEQLLEHLAATYWDGLEKYSFQVHAEDE